MIEYPRLTPFFTNNGVDGSTTKNPFFIQSLIRNKIGFNWNDWFRGYDYVLAQNDRRLLGRRHVEEIIIIVCLLAIMDFDVTELSQWIVSY